jgi:hypothetical protein
MFLAVLDRHAVSVCIKKTQRLFAWYMIPVLDAKDAVKIALIYSNLVFPVHIYSLSFVK